MTYMPQQNNSEDFIHFCTICDVHNENSAITFKISYDDKQHLHHSQQLTQLLVQLLLNTAFHYVQQSTTIKLHRSIARQLKISKMYAQFKSTCSVDLRLNYQYKFSDNFEHQKFHKIVY